MSRTNRYGVTVPLAGPLHEQRDRIRELVDLGYTELWSSEGAETEGFTPLALASQWAPELRLGIAIIPAYTRGPALLAQTVGTMCEAAPGRFAMGIGSSSNIIVERWNGIPFDEPYKRTRDVLRFLRTALTGEKVTEKYDSFEVNGFRLQNPPDPMPPILVGALREGMLRLAGKEGDGAIINWLSSADVATVAPYVHEGGADKEIVARIFVCPSDDADAVHEQVKFDTMVYSSVVPVYAAFQDWLGRGPQLKASRDAWESGDRKGAVAAYPDSVVDELIIHGPPEKCRELIDEYYANGVTSTSISIVGPAAADSMQALRDLSPAARS